MHNLIIESLKNQRPFFQSAESCFAFLCGGPEKYVQPRIGYELFNRTNGAFLTEAGVGNRLRVDFFGKLEGKRIAIETGANSLWNAREDENQREGVIKHMVEDTTKLFAKKCVDIVYTIGIVQALSRCDHAKHLAFVKYTNRYPLPFSLDDVQRELDKVKNHKHYFANKRLGVVQHLCIPTNSFRGYAMEIHFFVCGPFTHPLEIWWR